MRLRHIIFALSIGLLAAPARAADIGACMTPEGMTATLKAENQHSVASAEMISPEKHLFALVFTMSGDRKTGYILKSDKPTGERAGTLCVYNRMVDVRMFDARKPGVPPGALLKAPEADAAKHCDEMAATKTLPREGCGSHNAMLLRIEPLRERVALTGMLTRKDAQGRYTSDGTLATLSGRIGGTMRDIRNDPAAGILGGLMYSSLPDGAAFLNAVLVYVEYTPYGLAAIP